MAAPYNDVEGYHYRINSKAQRGKWLIREWCHYLVYYLPLIFIIIFIFIASLPFYLLCQFLKSEADIVEVTVMEVYREEKSVRRVRAGSKSSRFQTDFLFYGRNIEINNGQDYHLYRQQANSLHHFKYCLLNNSCCNN